MSTNPIKCYIAFHSLHLAFIQQKLNFEKEKNTLHNPFMTECHQHNAICCHCMKNETERFVSFPKKVLNTIRFNSRIPSAVTVT